MSRRKKVRDQFGRIVEGISVDVVESIERFSDVKLKDGTILKTKLSVLEAVRVDGEWDQEGNPSYVLRHNNVVSVVESPPELRNTN